MSESRIAIRYAKPLISLAKEKGKLEEIKKDMETLLRICDEERSFRLMLSSPVIPPLKKAQILRLIFKGKVDDLTMSIFDLMSRKSREGSLERVATEFVALYNEMKGIAEAKLITAIAIDEKLRKQFVGIIQEVSGKKVDLKEEVNPSLIGGFTLTIGDRRIDDSVSGKLRELKYALINN